MTTQNNEEIWREEAREELHKETISNFSIDELKEYASGNKIIQHNGVDEWIDDHVNSHTTIGNIESYVLARKKGQEELLLLKHDYAEKLGYLSSNRGVLQTPVTIAINQLDYEQRESRYKYEIQHLKQLIESGLKIVEEQELLLEKFERSDLLLKWKQVARKAVK